MSHDAERVLPTMRSMMVATRGARVWLRIVFRRSP